jgi:pimeloyl-ACP methyl ester carboxylesterase
MHQKKVRSIVYIILFLFAMICKSEVSIPYVYQKMYFSVNDFKISGTILLPDTLKSHPLIIYVWGSGQTNMDAHINKSTILRKFLEDNFAVLIYDKPGSGLSTGTLDPEKLFYQRTTILQKAIETVKKNHYIDTKRIGLYGSSQAAYIIANIFESNEDISFIASWSCPMQNSIDQSAYQIEQFLVCAGKSLEFAEKAKSAYKKRNLAEKYEDYYEYALILNNIPEIRDDLGWGEIISKEDYDPLDISSEMFLDPAKIIADIDIPFLAIYGENDKNINIRQAVSFLKSKQNEMITVKIIKNADHNLIVGGSGCIQEQIEGYKGLENPHVSEEFYSVIHHWLQDNIKP